MTTKHTLLKSFFSLGLILAFTSCDEDEQKAIPSSIPFSIPSTEFIQRELTIAEHEATSEISIILNETAIKTGIITIFVAAEDLSGFTTSPAAIDGKIQLSVSRGQGEATFAFTPIDNNLLNENQTIDFTIESVSEGFTIGNKNVLSVTLVDNESPALVGFVDELGSTLENSDQTTVAIALSHASPGSGSIEVSLESDNATYGIHFTTEPAAVNGKVVLPVELGIDHIEFNVIPLNDQLYNGHKTITYTITQTEGSVSKGLSLTHALKISDDELLGKAKGYTTGGGGWGYKKEFQYNEAGQVSRITWEQSAPGNTVTSTDTYEYDALGNVVKMVSSDFTETIYSWENGQIVKEESFKDGVLKKYILYGYDNAGNVGESAIHYRQPNGELKFSMLIVFLYREDGNIYKQINYSPIEGSEEYNLLSTKTFENYSIKENPFTMVEILPNKKTQPNLPLSYRLEEGGHNILYQLTYQFNEAGKPTTRTATSTIGTDVAFYEYY